MTHTVHFDTINHLDGTIEHIAAIDAVHRGKGKTPSEALLHAAMHWNHHERLQQEIAAAESCPKCKTGKLLHQRGGGVACNTNGCGYWFCY